ncbi:MAG: SCP2 sterol-binding domain-containing protein [Candidatus Thermoplasmatota archaeon]|nr:SCP2 sterol-binding domain-containing protein [Euryarchaeota archaeon]MBU4031612.1 SCP2 sterol-binding domain-containing protein [Candidatus Thermoplasmatota archaeon]MBU4072397.1 SCP2 sterol-binding domain-containing protein [Candidatus Thermoplasmatota archaeon]MBU4144932.1 SCP2 sterol-binding domain-containing protein [Candidatus Thermoplasmatota archaeon]MBU4591687.1 SCP2 sterol-binding domain-containing protein [Candidatus Thermoplasmatota archaeon]
MDELEGHIKNAIEKFKAKIAEDEELRNDLKEVVRNVNVDTTDNEGFSFILDKGEIKDFKRGKLETAEITLHATTDDFKQLFTGQLKPMKAWATKRLKFDASIDDVMRLKKLIS